MKLDINGKGDMPIITRIDQLPQGVPLYIYGAGEGGGIVLRRLQDAVGLTPAAFVDATKRGSLSGLPIIPAEDFLAGDAARPVVVASQHRDAISAELAQRGFEQVYDAWPIIQEALIDRLHGELANARTHQAMTDQVSQILIEMQKWRVRALTERVFGPPETPPPPPREIPADLLAAYTMGGRIPVYDLYADDTYPSNHPLIFTDAEIDAYLRKLEAGRTHLYGAVDTYLWRALERRPVRGASLAIMGSISPWYEATALHFGATPTTIDYNPIISASDRLRTMTFAGWKATRPRFDAAFSISSFEHDGLGRYGDPLNPDGDLQAMAAMKELVRPGGLLFLSVPVGRDRILFNTHRVYGRLRLPLLLQGWSELERIGCPDSLLDAEGSAEPIFVLQNNGSQ